MRITTLFWILLLTGTACKGPKEATLHHPSDALERLQAGNARFVSHKMKHPDQSGARLRQTASGQHPYAVVLTCADSRVSPEIIFDEGIGDLFVIRNAGNVADESDVLASIEYAVTHLGVSTVFILGHEHCGAIEAMTHASCEGEPEHVVALVSHIRNEPEEQEALHSGEKGEPLIHRCVLANVQHGLKAVGKAMEKVQHHHPNLNIQVVGGIYDMETGKVRFLNESPRE